MERLEVERACDSVEEPMLGPNEMDREKADTSVRREFVFFFE